MGAKPVAIIMGSQSDWTTLRHAAETLTALGIDYDARIVSAHRTPERLYEFARGARAAGFKVIIAGAGGAAHLPGMTAAMTILPVFGVPADAAMFLASRRPVMPDPSVLATTQDRLIEKDFIAGLGVATAPFVRVDS